MKFLFSTLLCLTTLSNNTFGQIFTQTVRGTVVDRDSKYPLIGASIVVANTNPKVGTVTDLKGHFKLEGIPTGRISLQISYVGYEPQTIPGILVNSAKEVVLDLSLLESTVQMNDVVVIANQDPGQALNEMAVISARSISSEETNRYAGGFNDPSRILSNFAGITATQDGSNDIIVRGNSPKYVQWRLEGIQITNPNHFADQASVGGSISSLNNNMLGTSDFHTGAFTAEYGDVLSGVYDIKLRTGNNEKFESVFGFGLLGTDFTIEGPFKKEYGGSYIANYRYFTGSLAADLDLVPDVGIPKFQDASFKLVLPTKETGTFSLFGLGGYSSLILEDVKPAIWETPGDRGMMEDITEDLEKKAYLLNTGLNHSINLTTSSYLNTTFVFSSEGMEDNIFETKRIQSGIEGTMQDSIISIRTPNFQSDITKRIYRGAITYHHKLDSRNKFQVGSKYALFNYKMHQSQFKIIESDRASLVNFDNSISTIRNFISWKHRINGDLDIVTGLHNMNVTLSNKSTFEPRLAVKWNASAATSVYAGFGKHSTMESVHNYFTRVEQPDGNYKEVNKDLDLLKANHYVLGVERRIGRNINTKVEVYYQDLYDLPVANSDTSYYATLNEGLDFQYVDLVNEGTGRNYGVEFTVERFFSNNFYYLLNGSLYESKYTPLDGVERNTRFNGNYLVNVLIGKEYHDLGRSGNKSVGLNAKIFLGGGQKYIPLLRDDDGNVSVNPSNGQFWDYEKAYQSKLEDTYQIILSASYKVNQQKASHELFLNLDNVTDNKGKISEYYDENEPNSVGYMTQFGFFPNLMYRVYF